MKIHGDDGERPEALDGRPGKHDVRGVGDAVREHDERPAVDAPDAGEPGDARDGNRQPDAEAPARPLVPEGDGNRGGEDRDGDAQERGVHRRRHAQPDEEERLVEDDAEDRQHCEPAVVAEGRGPPRAGRARERLEEHRRPEHADHRHRQGRDPLASGGRRARRILPSTVCEANATWTTTSAACTRQAGAARAGVAVMRGSFARGLRSPVAIGQREQRVDARADQVEVAQGAADLGLTERSRRDDEVQARALALQEPHLRHVVDLASVVLGIHRDPERILRDVDRAPRLLDLDDHRTPLRDEALLDLILHCPHLAKLSVARPGPRGGWRGCPGRSRWWRGWPGRRSTRRASTGT